MVMLLRKDLPGRETILQKELLNELKCIWTFVQNTVNRLLWKMCSSLHLHNTFTSKLQNYDPLC